MGQEIDSLRQEMLDWWFIFSNTGDCEDARMFLYSMDRYDDLLLQNTDDMER